METTSAADQVRGTCLVVGAAMVFALVALVVKVDPLPLLPATECRFFVSWVVSALFMLYFRKTRGLYWFGPPGLRGILLLKSVVAFEFIVLWWKALRHAPIGDCIAIIYASPILTSIWSLFILGERLPREFPVQVLFVVAGSLLVLDPPFLHSALATGRAARVAPWDYYPILLALLLCSITPIVTFRARACSWIEVEHVSAVVACMVMNPALLCTDYLVDGALPRLSTAPLEVALIVLAAAGSFVGIAMETKGYQLAEPGKATMFRYVEIPFAYLLQHLSTGAPIPVRAIVGALLIVGACAIGAVAQQARASRAKHETVAPLLGDSKVEVLGA